MKILYGSNDATKYILSYKKRGDFQEGYLLGQTPSYEIELQVKNKDGFFGDLSKQFTIFEGENQTGIFTVYEKPQRYTKTINLILYDNMLKLNPCYMSELDYDSNVTVKDQLNEIASLTGLSIIYSNLPSHILNKTVGWYDNTLSMRNHVGWIAEIAGYNVEINSSGAVTFKEISMGYDFETIRVGDLESEESWTVSRVCFDNGVALYEKGNSTNNTLYISENNPYCDDQSLIDYLYNKYNGLSLTGISKIRMRGIRDLRLGDVVKCNDTRFIVMSLTATEYGGESYPIYELTGVLPTKNKEMVENRTDIQTKLRRIQVVHDQNKAELSIISKDVSENKTSIGNLVVSNNEIKTEVSKKVGNDEIISKINQSAEEVKIQAPKISLEGLVTANENFKILEDGSIVTKNGEFIGKITALSGNIGDIDISDNGLIKEVVTDGITSGFRLLPDGTIVSFNNSTIGNVVSQSAVLRDGQLEVTYQPTNAPESGTKLVVHPTGIAVYSYDVFTDSYQLQGGISFSVLGSQDYTEINVDTDIFNVNGKVVSVEGHTHKADDITTTVPIEKGGTGAINARDALTNLGASPIGAKKGGALDVLWTGSSQTPSFSINSLSDYKYFLIRCGNDTSSFLTWVFCPYTAYGNIAAIRGIGGYETESDTNGGELYFVRGTFKDGIFTIEYACLRKTASITTNNSTVRLYVKDIVGVK